MSGSDRRNHHGTAIGFCPQCGAIVAFGKDMANASCSRCGAEWRRGDFSGESGEGGEEAPHRMDMYSVRDQVENLPAMSPGEIFRALEKHGYRGQDRGRKAVSLMAYRHVRRLKKIYLKSESREDLAPKLNYLMVGPTGCGKTFLVELLFQKILPIPTVIIDITTYSETGYVGDDVKSVLTRLLYAADGNPQWASCGIICIDEFDKLASSQNRAVFDGEGTTKDVTGMGVQKELLKMLEASEIIVPLEFGYSHFGRRTAISTADISFLACGAFSGFKGIIERRLSDKPFGLRQAPKPKFKEKIALRFGADELEDVETFQAYGFLPELLGRFTRVLPFDPLDADTLREILEINVIRNFKREFHDEGLELKIDVEVVEHLIELSIRKQTGARGLNSILTRCIEEAAYDSFGKKDGERKKRPVGVRLALEKGEVVSKID